MKKGNFQKNQPQKLYIFQQTIGSHFVSLEGKFLLIALVIVRDNASNAPKCPLNNGVQKLVVKLSNTSTMLFPPVAKNVILELNDTHSPNIFE
jgi:hypothetical protein